MIPTKLTEELDNLSSHGDGELILHDQEVVWNLQIANGQVLYASDGFHPVRRWHRTLKLNYPKWNWTDASSQISDSQNWECQILNQGIKQNQLSLIRAKLVIRSVIQECLFDLIRCSDLQSNWKPLPQLKAPFCQSAALSSWEMKTLLSRASKIQQEWQSANLSHLSPNLSPTLRQGADPEKLPVSRQYFSHKARSSGLLHNTSPPNPARKKLLASAAPESEVVLPAPMPPNTAAPSQASLMVQASTGDK